MQCSRTSKKKKNVDGEDRDEKRKLSLALSKSRGIAKYKTTYSERALRAGSIKSFFRNDSTLPNKYNSNTSTLFINSKLNQKLNSTKFLIIGDNLMAPFLALCMTINGLECDLAHHQKTGILTESEPIEYNPWFCVNDIDRGTICLTPSATQLMGDVFDLTVPSGSIVGRILTFDHVGNDICDINLNEFREKGESPTFFCCDRLKIEQALLSLCRNGANSCNIITNPEIPKRGGIEALSEGVRVHFTSGFTHEYSNIICTARNQDIIPEVTVSQDDLRQQVINNKVYDDALREAHHWMEICVPTLPDLQRYEKRFTPGSQELVEILSPRGNKMIVRPTIISKKLFYNVNITIPKDISDPRQKHVSIKKFWDDVANHWTGGVPGYIPHTMFLPMMKHIQNHFVKKSAYSLGNSLFYLTPIYSMSSWIEGEGRLIKIAHSAHGTCFDSIDISDAQGFTDCIAVARAFAEKEGSDILKIIDQRRLEVEQELTFHRTLTEYGIKQRKQFQYLVSRFKMKFLGGYKKSWRGILKNYTSIVK